MGFFKSGDYSINLDNVLYYHSYNSSDVKYLKKIDFQLCDKSSLTVSFVTEDDHDSFVTRLDREINDDNKKKLI